MSEPTELATSGAGEMATLSNLPYLPSVRVSWLDIHDKYYITMVWYGRDGSRWLLCPGRETPPSRAKLDLRWGKVRPRRASCRPEFSVLRAVYEGGWINKYQYITHQTPPNYVDLDKKPVSGLWFRLRHLEQTHLCNTRGCGLLICSWLQRLHRSLR